MSDSQTLLTAALATDIGRRRQQNQDNGVARPDLGLILVADGMGGHQGGEIASAMAVQAVTEVVEAARSGGKRKTDPDSKALLARALESANEKIFRRSSQDPALAGMGTTTTALLFTGHQLVIGQVGDSRCYLLRPGSIWQLTRDHSLVQEKLRAGLITREQLKTDRLKNVITRSVGFESRVSVELFEYEAQPGDAFLVCSDGLSGLVEDDRIRAEADDLLFGKRDIAGTVRRLIELANEFGGDDNVTVAIAQIAESH